MDIKDYIVLGGNTATSYNGGYKWTIPPSYYSNQRSSVATVELLQFNHAKNPIHELAFISTELGLQNQYASTGGRGVLAITENNEAGNSTYYAGPMKLLTAARPTEIVIYFYGADGVTKRTPDEFKLVLQFCYFNAEQTTKELIHQYTPTI